MFARAVRLFDNPAPETTQAFIADWLFVCVKNLIIELGLI
jgi:hypothetical protein